MSIGRRGTAIAAAMTALLVCSCGALHSGPSRAAASTTTSPFAGSLATAPAPQPSATYPNGISPAWLSDALSRWSSAAPSPLILSPTLDGDSYDNIEQPGNSLQVVDEELAMEEQTGAQAVTLDLGYDPFLLDNQVGIATDDAVIDAIRKSGHLVVIKDASAEYYRNHPLPWDQFAAAWVQRVKTIAARYHPDYYTVIKEPPWYAPMIAGLSRSDLSSPADQQVLNVDTWTSLLAELVAAVKEVSPKTKVGIAVDANLYRGQPGDDLDLKLMRAAAAMPGVDFLGFDVYTASAFSDTIAFLDQTDTEGKAIWINEAWSITSPTTDNPAQEQVDATWADVLLDFARTIHAQGVSPFYTDYFASYSPLPQTTSGLLAYYRGRTPVFGAFQRYETACHAKTAGAAVSTPC